MAYASCHSLRLISRCAARRSAFDLGACAAGSWRSSSWATLSAWASQSSSSHALGTFLLLMLRLGYLEYALSLGILQSLYVIEIAFVVVGFGLVEEWGVFDESLERRRRTVRTLYRRKTTLELGCAHRPLLPTYRLLTEQGPGLMVFAGLISHPSFLSGPSRKPLQAFLAAICPGRRQFHRDGTDLALSKICIL